VKALRLHDQKRARVELDARTLTHQIVEPLLIGELDLPERLEQRRVVLMVAQLRQRGQVGWHPARAEPPRDQAGEARVRVQKPAPRRDAVGLVVEALGPELVKISQEILHDEIAVQLGHAVDAVRADGREVRHADLPHGPFFDDRHACHALDLTRPAALHLVQEALVDLVDDLNVARQHALEDADGPALERFRHERVIGVTEGSLRDRPGALPLQHLDVHEHAHQLGDRDRWVRVVQLDRRVIGQLLPGALALFEGAEDVGDRARHEEVLLFEPQLLALLSCVVRVEHLGDILHFDLLFDRARVVALVEQIEIEVARRARGPQPQCVHGVGVVTDDKRVVGHTHDALAVHPIEAHLAAVGAPHMHLAVELHALHVLMARQLPGIAVLQPSIPVLDLLTAVDVLLEDAVFVANAVADSRQVERRQRIHEAGRQATEAAIAEARVALTFQHLVELEAALSSDPLGHAVQAEIQET
jgi:hypothetical protein